MLCWNEYGQWFNVLWNTCGASCLTAIVCRMGALLEAYIKRSGGTCNQSDSSLLIHCFLLPDHNDCKWVTLPFLQPPSFLVRAWVTWWGLIATFLGRDHKRKKCTNRNTSAKIQKEHMNVSRRELARGLGKSKNFECNEGAWGPLIISLITASDRISRKKA